MRIEEGGGGPAAAGESELVPESIVRHLNEYIIGQDEAKRAVSIALRNRWRRLNVPVPLRDEITPKNIILIGPTGVGKTEISRRLAKLAGAPFVKVEATRFTEVGYVGRDVESIIRDLAEAAFTIVKNEERQVVRSEAERQAEERLLDLLYPASPRLPDEQELSQRVIYQREDGVGYIGEEPRDALSTREKLREMLRAGTLDERIVEIEVEKPSNNQMQLLGPQGFGEFEGQIRDMFQNLLPRRRARRRVPVREARVLLIDEVTEQLIDQERVAERAVERASQTGIVVIDEVDKICGPNTEGRGLDVSRAGVQRDLLPLVEGARVQTKYGAVDTEHILFIASGAFHVSKPSDLMPEFQGRFPIRVELRSLEPDDFVRILCEPKNALIKQYQALLATEGVRLEFTGEAIRELGDLTARVNAETEDIGARRLHTILEKLLEEISFSAHERTGEHVVIVIDEHFVRERLADLAADHDLSRYIL